MKLPVSDEAIDQAKKTLGTLLLGLAAVAEIFLDPASQWGRAGIVAGMIGGVLLGLGLMNARGKAASALLQQVFGTSKVAEIAPQTVETVARISARPPDARVEQSTLDPRTSGAHPPVRPNPNPNPNPPPPPRRKQ